MSPRDSASPPADGSLEVRSKVWLERDGEVVISEFRADLLRAIDDTGSVAAAAEQLGLPYRTAWKKLRRMEGAAGRPLLASDSGGSDGGGTVLTPAARELLEAFQRLNEPVTELLEAEFTRERPSIAATLDVTSERLRP